MEADKLYEVDAAADAELAGRSADSVDKPIGASDNSIAEIYSKERDLELESGTEQNISDKARDYVAKKKEEIRQEIQAKFADSLTTYEAIRCHKNRSLMACSLFGNKSTIPALDLGTFFSGSDGRMAGCTLRNNFTSKHSVCYSFSPDTLKCFGCGSAESVAHRILSSYNSEESCSRVAFLLCDQGGPPSLLSATTGKNCLPVIRCESATLRELAEIFFGTTRIFRLPPGSICIIASATQLAQGGVGEYTRDLVTVHNWFNNRYKGEVDLVPGPVLINNGCNSKQLISSMAELGTWCRVAGGLTGTLADTMEVALTVAKEVALGELQSPQQHELRLPNSIADGDLAPWFLHNINALPVATAPVSTSQEA